MKKLYTLIFTLFCFSVFSQEAVITGYMDSPCPSQSGRTLEIYVDGTIDFTGWSLVRQSNGGGFTPGSFTLDISSLGTITDDFAYITNSSATLDSEFGITTNVLESSSINSNGNDGFQLVDGSSIVIDRFGEDGVNGSGTAWDHLDTYYYRVDGTAANGGAFQAADFTYGPLNFLDGKGLCNGDVALSTLVPFGTYSTTPNTLPTVTITSPADFQVFPSGTTFVNVEFTIENAPGATVNISYSVNGGSSIDAVDVSSPFEVSPLADGDSVTLTAELVDGGILDFETIDFSIAFPCDIQVGTITETCDAVTPGPDTYDVTIEYTGGATTTYTIDTGGIGTVAGDNPTSVAAGTIQINDIPEGTDFVVTFTGDPANSSCDFTRNINSPDCDPQLTLPLAESFAYADGPLTANPNWADYSGTALQIDVLSEEVYILQDGSQSEDASIAFTPTSGGDIFYSFDFRVPNPGGAITGGDYEYFACFKDDGFGLRARVDIIEATSGGDFTVGLSTLGSTADVAWGSDLSFDTSYNVTVRYDQDNNVAELWIDATMQSDTSVLSNDEAAAAPTISQFAFRQSNSSTDETIIVDNLTIAPTFNEVLSNGANIEVNDFSIYPNPTNSGYVTIATSLDDSINVEVYDMLGKIVKKTSIQPNTNLDVNQLKSGIYIVRLEQNNATITKKLVIK